MSERPKIPAMSTAATWLGKIRWSHLILAALAFGVLLRLVHFSFGRMLWLDEATIAINFISRDGADYFQPLDFRQIAPAFWMMLMDGFWTLFHNLEYGLRLPSLLAGIAALLVFWQIVRERFSPAVVLITVFAFAFSYMPVYYSAEVKPYIFDLLLSALLLFQGLRLIEKDDWPLSDLIWIGVTMLVGSCLAMGAPIIIGGVGGVLGLKALLDRRWGAVALLVGFAAISAMIYLVPALSAYQEQISAAGLDEGGHGNYFARHFAPFPPTSLGDLTWYIEIAQETLGPMVGRDSTYVFVLLILIGGVLAIRRSRWVAAIILAPIAFGFLFSAAQIYPIMSRLALYLLPIALLLAAYVFEKLLTELPQRTNWIVVSALLLMNIGSVTWHRYYHTFNPNSSPRDVSQELKTVADNIRQDEILVVTAWSLPAFLLYRQEYKLDQVNWTVADRAECFYASPIDIETRGRVWFLKGLYGGTGPNRISSTFDLIVADAPKRIDVKPIDNRLERLKPASTELDFEPEVDCPQRKVKDVYLMDGRPPLLRGG